MRTARLLILALGVTPSFRASPTSLLVIDMRLITTTALLFFLTQPIFGFAASNSPDSYRANLKSKKPSSELRACLVSAWKERYPDLVSRPNSHAWRVIAYDSRNKMPVADAAIYALGTGSLVEFRAYGESIRWTRSRLEACR